MRLTRYHIRIYETENRFKFLVIDTLARQSWISQRRFIDHELCLDLGHSAAYELQRREDAKAERQSQNLTAGR